MKDVPNKIDMHTYTYLALGDSYTIGETLPLYQSFPYQVVQLLREKQFQFPAPEIIAKTGWTTDELEQALQSYHFLARYDFVSLLIGVNNQYRGKEVIEYKEHFEELLKRAITLANGRKERVFVMSIPDYSITPFSASADKEKIAREIDIFNNVNKAVSIQYKVHYLDITTQNRLSEEQDLVASDGLHPSAKEYEKWAKGLSELIAAQLK